jgi:hypothetical protein
MLSAVQPHYQFRLVTKKVCDIAANRNLPAELEPKKLPVANAGPQFPPGAGFLPPEFPG